MKRNERRTDRTREHPASGPESSLSNYEPDNDKDGQRGQTPMDHEELSSRRISARGTLFRSILNTAAKKTQRRRRQKLKFLDLSMALGAAQRAAREVAELSEEESEEDEEVPDAVKRERSLSAGPPRQTAKTQMPIEVSSDDEAVESAHVRSAPRHERAVSIPRTKRARPKTDKQEAPLPRAETAAPSSRALGAENRATSKRRACSESTTASPAKRPRTRAMPPQLHQLPAHDDLTHVPRPIRSIESGSDRVNRPVSILSRVKP